MGIGCIFGLPEPLALAAVFPMATELGLAISDLRTIYAAFGKDDLTSDGEINVDEFELSHRLENNDAYAKLVFSVFDGDGDGRITFSEFLLALWNLLTSSDDDCVKFTFRIFDRNGDGCLELDEFVRMLHVVTGRNDAAIKVVDLAHHFLREMKGKKEGDGPVDVTAHDFLILTRKSHLIMWPAFQLRNQLQTDILGVARWKRLAKRREERFPALPLEDIVQTLTYKPPGPGLVLKPPPRRRVSGAAAVSAPSTRPSTGRRDTPDTPPPTAQSRRGGGSAPQAPPLHGSSAVAVWTGDDGTNPSTAAGAGGQRRQRHTFSTFDRPRDGQAGGGGGGGGGGGAGGGGGVGGRSRSPSPSSAVAAAAVAALTTPVVKLDTRRQMLRKQRSTF